MCQLWFGIMYQLQILQRHVTRSCHAPIKFHRSDGYRTGSTVSTAYPLRFWVTQIQFIQVAMALYCLFMATWSKLRNQIHRFFAKERAICFTKTGKRFSSFSLFKWDKRDMNSECPNLQVGVLRQKSSSCLWYDKDIKTRAASIVDFISPVPGQYSYTSQGTRLWSMEGSSLHSMKGHSPRRTLSRIVILQKTKDFYGC